MFFSFYRFFVSPMLHAFAGPGFGCRFVPTCGEYAEEAIHEHGALKGTWLATCRVCRCHPWSEAGYDPVLSTAEAGRVFKKG